MRGTCIVRSNVQHGINEQMKIILAFAQSEGVNVNHTVIIESDADLNDIDFTNTDCLIVVDESRISRYKETFENFRDKLEELNVSLKVINSTK
ncbi:recombinase family protein [Paenibacillus sp. QZ-Y1]|uniref:recombinase family protein n=1 Tax=Paenibacillus sp. QZ-Y1 TaxID=3414511 RepID=UPI003F791243